MFILAMLLIANCTHVSYYDRYFHIMKQKVAHKIIKIKKTTEFSKKRHIYL